MVSLPNMNHRWSNLPSKLRHTRSLLVFSKSLVLFRTGKYFSRHLLCDLKKHVGIQYKVEIFCMETYECIHLWQQDWSYPLLVKMSAYSIISIGSFFIPHCPSQSERECKLLIILPFYSKMLNFQYWLVEMDSHWFLICIWIYMHDDCIMLYLTFLRNS